MIITQIVEGLGNQMHMYALGRHLAHLNGSVLRLDVGAAGKNNSRPYRLHLFNIQEHYATPEEIWVFKSGSRGVFTKTIYNMVRFLGNGFSKLGVPGFATMAYYRNCRYIEEAPYRYEQDILRIRGHAYLKGFWEDYRYFEDIRHVLQREFTLRYPPIGLNKELLDKVLTSNAVAVHIRRGDKASSRRFAFCPPDYYHKAMHIVKERVDTPHFFVFSDDPGWARDTIGFGPALTLIENNLNDAEYEDFRLMQNCKHHIIANSTFSWWAAYLNPNPEPVIIAPAVWFTEQERVRQCSLVIDADKRLRKYPDHWVLV